MWKAARRVFTDVTMQGCNFHWKQAVFHSYRPGLKNGLFITRPCKWIHYEADGSAISSNRACDACLWSPQTTSNDSASSGCLRLNSVYMDGILNMVCGWMELFYAAYSYKQWLWRLASKLERGQKWSPPPFFCLAIIKLHEMTEFTNLYTRLAFSGKMVRRQRKMYRSVQGKIFSRWEKYENRDITTDHLLSAISHLNV